MFGDNLTWFGRGGYGLSSTTFFGSTFGGIFVIILIILFIYLIVRVSKPQTVTVSKKDDPLEIVKVRYAKGEITYDEYKEITKNLS